MTDDWLRFTISWNSEYGPFASWLWLSGRCGVNKKMWHWLPNDTPRQKDAGHGKINQRCIQSPIQSMMSSRPARFSCYKSPPYMCKPRLQVSLRLIISTKGWSFSYVCLGLWHISTQIQTWTGRTSSKILRWHCCMKRVYLMATKLIRSVARNRVSANVTHFSFTWIYVFIHSA